MDIPESFPRMPFAILSIRRLVHPKREAGPLEAHSRPLYLEGPLLMLIVIERHLVA